MIFKTIAVMQTYTKSGYQVISGMSIISSGTDFIEFEFNEVQPDTNYYFVGLNMIEEIDVKNGAYSLNTKTTTGFRLTYLEASVSVGDPDWGMFSIVRENNLASEHLTRLSKGEIDTFVSIRNGVVISKSFEFPTIEFFVDRIKLNFRDADRGNPKERTVTGGPGYNSEGQIPFNIQVVGSEKIGISAFVLDNDFIEIYIKYVDGGAFDNTNASINLTQFSF